MRPLTWGGGGGDKRKRSVNHCKNMARASEGASNMPPLSWGGGGHKRKRSKLSNIKFLPNSIRRGVNNYSDFLKRV